MKSVQIRRFLWSKYKKLRTREYSLFGHFSRFVGLDMSLVIYGQSQDFAIVFSMYFLSNLLPSSQHPFIGQSEGEKDSEADHSFTRHQLFLKFTDFPKNGNIF